MFRTTLEDALWYAKEEKYKEAFDRFMQCAKQGSAFAQKMVGMMYAEGNGVEKNEEEAKKWITMSRFYCGKEDYRDLYKDKPIDECETDAANGNTSAMLWLAHCFAKGDCGKSKDLDKAVSLIADAAHKGDPDAMRHYALCFKEGEPFPSIDIRDEWEKKEDTHIPQDFDKALEWFRRGCDYGDCRSIHSIGSYYLFVEDDPRKMQFYFDMATQNMMRMNPDKVNPPLMSQMRNAFNSIIPLMYECDRCGKIFRDIRNHASYTCDQCHKTVLLCQACQAENISCCECGKTMRLTEEG